MLYTELKIGDKELKLRLRAKDCVDLEKRLGGSPLDQLMMIEQGKMPTVTTVVLVLHASLQAFNKGYTLDKVYELFDEYVEDGGTVMDFVPKIMDIFKVSGFFKTPETTPEEIIQKEIV